MFKTTYIGAVLGGLMFLGMALPASAMMPLPPSTSALTTAQISAVISLLQSFGADQAIVANVQAALGGIVSSDISCIALSRNLTLGAKGTDVSNMQNYLIAKGHLASGYNTGYYGSMTAQAVGKLQVNLGIVSSPKDAAYGFVGPITRAKIGCGSEVQQKAAISATPTSGHAPLAVSFVGSKVTGGSQYILDYGDGANSGPLAALDVCMHLSDGSGGCPKVSSDHTYTAAGTYTATLEPYIACMWSNPRCMIATMPLATTKIVVTGDSSSQSFSATPTSGTAPLTVSFGGVVQGEMYRIEYGDGTSGIGKVECATAAASCNTNGTMSVDASYVYRAPGTYSAMLYNSSGKLIDTQLITVNR
jgi:PKD repeat protein